MEQVKEKIKKSGAVLQEKLGIKNALGVPRLEKIVISSGTGSIKDKRQKDLVVDRLTKITGQKAAVRGAKKSVANFKLRQGDPIGVVVTLRGGRMYEFLDRLIHVAIPRMRDFKGINKKNIDSVGNITLGIKEHTIFPETGDEDLRDVFGLSITIVTTAHSSENAYLFLKELGLPLKDE